MKSKISKILITVGLLICVGSLSIKGYSKYLENKSTKSFEEKIDKNKIRIIHKLDFYPHRIIQHAILQVMEKKWKPSLIKNTYQSIKHRGIVKCKRDVEKCLKRMAKVNKGNDTYVVKLVVNIFVLNIEN